MNTLLIAAAFFFSCQQNTLAFHVGNDKLAVPSPSSSTAFSRRSFVENLSKGALGGLGLLIASPDRTVAATPPTAKSDTIFRTGRSPIVPGEKKDPKDTKGTRKDPGFLRSVSDCKSRCELAGSGGLATSKEDCLSICQDIVCTTYEQCTFAIVPR